MAMTVTTLIENHSADNRLTPQYGLSLYLTDGNFSLLLDTGSDGEFLKNADALGIDLHGLDILVLSHGHSDHTGGVKPMLEADIAAKEMYMGENFFTPRYKRKTGRLCPLSTQFSEEYLMTRKIKYFLLQPGVHQLHKKIYLVTGIPSVNDIELPNENLVCQCGREYITDPFSEETVVVVKGDNGLAILSGCSHSGIINTCEWVSRLFEQPVHTFIGGTHLMESNDIRLRATMEHLQKMGIKRLGACHCHGDRAKEVFANEFEGFFDNGCGTFVTL